MIYYLIAILTNIKMFLVVITIFLFCGCLAILISMADTHNTEKDLKQIYTDFKKMLSYFIITALLLVFIPSQKQAAFIMIAPAIVENKDLKETVKNIPELTKLGTEYLKEMLINEKEAVNK